GPGVFDNLKELAAICRKEEIWLHVDAAHGGLLKMSEQYSYLLEGIEEADSITIDFHKLGFTPALTTAVLYRKALDSYRPFTQEASYLWSEEAEDPGIQSGLRTLECTKLMMGLKAFANLVWLGEDEMRRMMDSLVSQTRDFASWLQDQPGWELFQYPEANILCFKSTDYSEKQHKEALKRLVASGTYYIVSTVIDGQFYFRITVMNVYTEESHLKTLIEQLKQHLDECKS
ncbi:MAG: pyridoxal phosphate-dependent decarboxylase family protein, partial [Luteibaculum sp.]